MQAGQAGKAQRQGEVDSGAGGAHGVCCVAEAGRAEVDVPAHLCSRAGLAIRQAVLTWPEQGEAACGSGVAVAYAATGGGIN